MGPTGGYLIAFPFAAFLIGWLTERRRELWWTVLALIAGSLVIFTVGTVHLYLTYTHSWSSAFSGGFLIFSWWDVVKIIAAASILYGAQRTSAD
jgi:biotin transport system substrate-specific component